MRAIAKILSLLPLCLGLAVLAFGGARARLPYENERYFDPRTNVVYHLQTAETLIIAGSVLTLLGIVIAFGAFRFLGRRRPSSLRITSKS